MTPAELKAIRRQHRLTQNELAALLRISDSRTIRRWESGERPVSGPASIVLEMMSGSELPVRYFLACDEMAMTEGDA